MGRPLPCSSKRTVKPSANASLRVIIFILRSSFVDVYFPGSSSLHRGYVLLFSLSYHHFAEESKCTSWCVGSNGSSQTLVRASGRDLCALKHWPFIGSYS